uniref:Putative ovule protein n=1 Tax=Solanum chacoense TaxID=4108 RepID=A0A0V0GV63_SOLCH
MYFSVSKFSRISKDDRSKFYIHVSYCQNSDALAGNSLPRACAPPGLVGAQRDSDTRCKSKKKTLDV